jgi:hypothetical protein
MKERRCKNMWRWWRGRGWGFGGYVAPWCPWAYYGRRGWRGAGYYPYYGITKEEEKELLEAWKKDLEAELEDIKRRLEELK